MLMHTRKLLNYLKVTEARSLSQHAQAKVKVKIFEMELDR